jgi:hypothetical protein
VLDLYARLVVADDDLAAPALLLAQLDDAVDLRDDGRLLRLARLERAPSRAADRP